MRATRTPNAMDLWYKRPANKEHVNEVAQVQLEIQLEEYKAQIQAVDAGDGTRAPAKNLKKPTKVGLTAKYRKELFQALPDDERQYWEKEAQNSKEGGPIAMVNQAYKYVFIAFLIYCDIEHR